jgi:hypothetical protein
MRCSRVFSSNNSGGIVGNGAGTANGTVYVSNCYSKGNISGNRSGGIFGSYAGNANTTGKVVVDSCYSFGNITSSNCGGPRSSA